MLCERQREWRPQTRARKKEKQKVDSKREREREKHTHITATNNTYLSRLFSRVEERKRRITRINFRLRKQALERRKGGGRERERERERSRS
jgi:hypothetical protein